MIVTGSYNKVTGAYKMHAPEFPYLTTVGTEVPKRPRAKRKAHRMDYCVMESGLKGKNNENELH